MGETGNRGPFASTTANAKLVRTISRLVRKAGLDYHGLRRVFAQVRGQLGLERPPKAPQAQLPESSLRRLYEIIEHTRDRKHQILLRLLFSTEIPVPELASITVEDVDLEDGRILLGPAEADQGRYIQFNAAFGVLLRAYRVATPGSFHLFETSRGGPYSPRRVEQIMKACTEAAGISPTVHPHRLRAEMRRWSAGQGLPEAQIRLLGK